MAANKAASIKQKLLNIARERRETFDFVLRQYVLQRLMYRLSISKYANQFLLKGGLLFWVWNKDFHRPTQDMDLLGFIECDIEQLHDLFKEVIQPVVQEGYDDGLNFDLTQLTAEEIKEDAKYQGVRITGRTSLERAQCPFQIDIGFGDTVTGVEEVTEVPAFIDDLPKPKLRTYPVETVVAEKFQTMMVLGIANSRMKDFYDIYTIAETIEIEADVLAQAIRATFQRRDTLLDVDNAYIFTEEFKRDDGLAKLWLAFIKKNRLNLELTFAQVVEHIEAFITSALNHSSL